MEDATTDAIVLDDRDAGEPLLELVGVRAAYGRIEVLHGVDLAIPHGSVVALLGPNGAGKTTTLKVASGQVVPTHGHLHLAGRHVNGAPVHELARLGLCTIPEGRGIFPNLTVEENLRMAAHAGAATRAAHEIRERAYERFPKLAERRAQVAGTLSGGEQQMLGLSRALGVDPALLLLDELSMGLAPLVVESLYEVIRQLADEGLSILLVEQFAETALEVADRAVVMRSGRLVAGGDEDAVREALSDAYLGR